MRIPRHDDYEHSTTRTYNYGNQANDKSHPKRPRQEKKKEKKREIK